MASAELSILKALSIKGVGPAKIKSLINHIDDFVAENEKQNNTNTNWAESIISSCDHLGIIPISFIHPAYPDLLRKCKDFPLILYCRGDISLLKANKIASVVGTRKASEYGRRASRKIAYNLSCEGFTIVSGMALGIDREAHLGSIDGGTPGIVVLASGVDKPSPTSNKDIYEKILSTNGLIISEHEPGFPIIKTELVKRNRIQSGISNYSIIIETGETGGTISQATYAKEQGKRILTMIPNENSLSSQNCDYSGSNKLIMEFGAEAFSSWEDLVKVITRTENQTTLENNTEKTLFD